MAREIEKIQERMLDARRKADMLFDKQIKDQKKRYHQRELRIARWYFFKMAEQGVKL